MAGPNDNYRDDGCGGIHSGDVDRAVENGDLYEGSDGNYYDDDNNCYSTDGKLL